MFVCHKYTLTVFLSFCNSECKLFAVFINKDFVRQLKAFLPSLCHLYVPVKCPWGGAFDHLNGPSVGHLNGILAPVGGNLNNNFRKSQMPGGLPVGGVG